MTGRQKLEISLLLLRLSVFLVMAVWTADKFLDPEHGVRIFDYFYGLGGTPVWVVQLVGVAEAMIILGFVLGVAKRWTYGFVLIAHGLSTFSSWKQYTIDINLLFFAAWPMFAACVALYLLRDYDRMWTVRPDDPKTMQDT